MKKSNIQIFFSNGLMSALASCLIIDYINKYNCEDKFILCIEKNDHHDPVYYQVLDILVQQNKNLYQIEYIDAEFRVMDVRNPLHYLKSIIYYKKIANSLKTKLGQNILENVTKIWAPSTSRLWPFFKKKNIEFRAIEHGIGEYISGYTLSSKSKLKRTIRSWLDDILGYPSHYNYDSLWLCSNAIVLSRNEKIVQHNFFNEFNEYSINFWKQYQISFPEAVKEINKIKEKINDCDKNVYFYLPSDEIKHELYHEFIAQQMSILESGKSSLFIVKKHPGDLLTNYDIFLSPFGECINILELSNSYLPAEFLAVFFDIQNVMGSCSSTLFYLNSWKPNIRLHIHNDYESHFLKDDWSLLLYTLASANLINTV